MFCEPHLHMAPDCSQLNGRQQSTPLDMSELQNLALVDNNAWICYNLDPVSKAKTNWWGVHLDKVSENGCFPERLCRAQSPHGKRWIRLIYVLATFDKKFVDTLLRHALVREVCESIPHNVSGVAVIQPPDYDNIHCRARNNSELAASCKLTSQSPRRHLWGRKGQAYTENVVVKWDASWYEQREGGGKNCKYHKSTTIDVERQCGFQIVKVNKVK